MPHEVFEIRELRQPELPGGQCPPTVADQAELVGSHGRLGQPVGPQGRAGFPVTAAVEINSQGFGIDPFGATARTAVLAFPVGLTHVNTPMFRGGTNGVGL